MSVASINNGTLQLSDLIVSNEKYSNSAGYAPSTATFSAGLTGTSIFVPAISATEITIPSLTPPDAGYKINSYSNVVALTAGSASVTPTLLLTNSVDTIELSVPSNGVLEVNGNVRIDEPGTTGYVNLNCTGQGELNVETLVVGTDGLQTSLYSYAPGVLQIRGNLQLFEPGSTSTYVNLNCTTNDTLSVSNLVVNGDAEINLVVDGNATIGNSLVVGPNIVGGVDYSYMKASYYTGGLGRFQGSLNYGTIGPGAKYFFPAVTIPGFIGTATSSYVISSNYTDSAVVNPLIWSVQFVSADSETNTTIVSVEVYNTLTATNILGPNNVSIIAMN
jgi:hypothetical protein